MAGSGGPGRGLGGSREDGPRGTVESPKGYRYRPASATGPGHVWAAFDPADIFPGMKGFRRTVLGELLYAIPPAIRWILVSCVVIWFVELMLVSFGGARGAELVFRWLALIDPIPWLWQLVTYAFLHDPYGPLHVGINMFMLWMFGRDLEGRWGWANFLQFYLLCAVGAALCHLGMMLVLPAQANAPVVGASGAIFGLLAAYGLLFGERTILLFFVVPIKAKYAVLLFAALELMVAWNPANGVANFAHLGGMATGYLYLKHAWRLGNFSPFGWAKGRLAGMRRARRRARFEVVNEKEWDEWLERELDDETRH